MSPISVAYFLGLATIPALVLLGVACLLVWEALAPSIRLFRPDGSGPTTSGTTTVYLPGVSGWFLDMRMGGRRRGASLALGWLSSVGENPKRAENPRLDFVVRRDTWVSWETSAIEEADCVGTVRSLRVIGAFVVVTAYWPTRVPQ